MQRASLIAAAAGALGGVLLVAAWHGSFFGILLGMMFSPLPLMMTAFGLGLAYLPVAVVAGAVTVTVLTGSVALAVVYLVFDGLPTAILARIGLAAEKLAAAAPPGTMPQAAGRDIAQPVVVLSVVAVVLMAAALAMFPAGPDGLQAGMVARLDTMLDETGALRQMPEGARKTLVEAMVRVLPGAAVWNWILRALASAVVGQALLRREGLARWATPAYRTIAVPGWYVGIFWLAAFAAWLVPGDAGFVVANAAIVMSAPLALQGLAVVHHAVAAFGLGRIALVAFYGLSLVALGPALVLIVTLGVMEHFTQLRRRMGTARNGG
jgi:hypothetical protein